MSIGNGTSPDDVTLDLERVMRQFGPYSFGSSSPSDDELFGALESFGRIVWRLPSAAKREAAKQQWVDYLREKTLLGISQPWRVVDQAIAAGLTTGTTTAGPRFLTDVQLGNLPRTADLIQGIVSVGAFSVIYGAPGCGKTFLGLSMALSVATRTDWYGHPVARGPVAYVIAEGVSGLPRRIEAWKTHHRYAGSADVYFMPQAVRVLEAGDTAAVIAELQAWDEPPKLVVMDTMAQSLVGGDENSAADVGRFIHFGNQIRQTFGATFTAIHHTGWEPKRERGHSSLRGAADTMIKVEGSEDQISVTCEKQKDGVPFTPLRFQLEPSADSVVPIRVGEQMKDLSHGDLKCLEALRAITVNGEGVPSGRWDQVAEMNRSSFFRSRAKLIQLGHVRFYKSKNYIVVSQTAVSSPMAVP